MFQLRHKIFQSFQDTLACKITVRIAPNAHEKEQILVAREAL